MLMLMLPLLPWNVLTCAYMLAYMPYFVLFMLSSLIHLWLHFVKSERLDSTLIFLNVETIYPSTVC